MPNQPGITLVAVGLLAIVANALLFSQGTPVDREPPVTVPFVDLERYMGTWYEIASIPSYFSLGCSKTTATYSLNQDSTVKVDNKCLKFGKWTGDIGKATPQDKTNAKLKVSFRPEHEGNYWIVRLASNYNYVVVSDDIYDFLWVLSRTPTMDAAFYSSIVENLKKDNFDTDKLVLTEQ